MARAVLGQQRVGGPMAADRLWLCASLLTAQYLFFSLLCMYGVISL